MTKPLGLLLSCFDFSPVAEDEFHDWYDTEHIPERQRVPGFLDCRRWLAPDGRRISVATYDLASVDVLQSPGYLAIGYENNSPWTRRVGWRCIKLLRMEGEQIVPGGKLPPARAGALAIRAVNLAPGYATRFAGWFTEHAAGLSRVPGLLCGRLFRATAGTHQYAALYHFDSPDVAASGAWRDLADIPWLENVAPYEKDRMDLIVSRYVRISPP